MARKKRKEESSFIRQLKSLGIKDRRQIEIFMYILTKTDPQTNLYIGTYKRIAYDMGCSEATIAKVLKTLQDRGIVTKFQNGVWCVDQSRLYGDEDGAADLLTGSGAGAASSPVKNKPVLSEKIKMDVPIVEMDGDEMTRIIWQMIKDKLILPYVELKTEYYDLGLAHRDETSDRVTRDAAEAVKKYGVGVKCATITPNKARVEEYSLKEMYKSPNGTIRAMLDGTVFRAPIMVKGIDPYVKTWKKPITIARHAYGDLYSASEMRIEGSGKAELVFTYEDGREERKLIKDFQSSGILQGQHNLDSSIESFARSCFNYALESGQSLWFSAKDTISKIYDHHFKDVFQEIFDKEYKDRFEEKGLEYFYTLIDDAVARVVKSEGGFIWACKNYDGDVMSDMVATAFGALAMMTSVLVSPEGYYEFEAAHGTVQRHYYKHLKGEETSTNSVATIFAWTGALKKRGQLDGNDALCDFADYLEGAVVSTIESGRMTKDLSLITSLKDVTVLNTEEFIDAVRERLES